MIRGARIASGIVIAIVVIGVAWGWLEPRIWLDEREIEARLPGLSTAWEGEELAIIADLQVGMWGSNGGMLKRVVRRIVERRPRALLVAGDFVYKPEKDLDARSLGSRTSFDRSSTPRSPSTPCSGTTTGA